MKTIYKSGTVETITDSVAAELSGCTFIIYCADDKRFAQISSKLHELMPEIQMIGTTGFMFNESGSMAEGISAVGFKDSEVEARTGILPHVDTCPIKHLKAFTASVDAIKRGGCKDSICFEFSTGYEEKVVSTLKIGLEPSGMRLVGGTPGNTTPDGPKQVACNGEVFHDACVYAVVGSKIGKIKIFKENLYKKGNITHNITKVSADGRTIYEIDGRKAMDVYEEELMYNSATVQEGVFRSPLARIVGAESYIIAIFSFNADRSISTYKNCQRNDLISFTTIEEDYQKFMHDNMRDLTVSTNVVGMISVNCILRYLFFENNHYTGSYAQMMKQMSNGCHWGFVGDGEQYMEQHINQSMVCAVFTKDR